MAVKTLNLWKLVHGQPQVDPNDLAAAIEEEARQDTLDYRTRLLIHDSLAALRKHWGQQRLERRLGNCAVRPKLDAIAAEAFDAVGFPSLTERIVERTDPETIKQYLRDLGSALSAPLRLDIGGSVSLMLAGYLARHTEDIDVVDEVPAEIRGRHKLVADLRTRYGLSIGHFQSHYLPDGWQSRLHYLGEFGKLTLYMVDVYDVFLCKLFSRRTKDLDDLRILAPRLDREKLIRLFKDATTSLRKEEALRAQAEHNWYVLYGESLPA